MTYNHFQKRYCVDITEDKGNEENIIQEKPTETRESVYAQAERIISRDHVTTIQEPLKTLKHHEELRALLEQGQNKVDKATTEIKQAQSLRPRRDTVGRKANSLSSGTDQTSVQSTGVYHPTFKTNEWDSGGTSKDED